MITIMNTFDVLNFEKFEKPKANVTFSKFRKRPKTANITHAQRRFFIKGDNNNRLLHARVLFSKNLKRIKRGLFMSAVRWNCLWAAGAGHLSWQPGARAAYVLPLARGLLDYYLGQDNLCHNLYTLSYFLSVLCLTFFIFLPDCSITSIRVNMFKACMSVYIFSLAQYVAVWWILKC